MRPLRIAAVVAVAVVAAVLLRGPGTPDRPVGEAERVLIVSIPTLTWEQVADREPGNLTGFFATSAVASTSVRTLGADTDLGEGYATIGAGNRASVPRELAGLALPPDAEYDGDPVLDVYQRRYGVEPGDADVLHLGAAGIQRRNDGLLYGTRVGSLGSAVRQAGGATAVVGNADFELDPLAAELHREVVLGVMDDAGRVDAGRIDPGLLVEDSSAPGGVRLDEGAVVETVRGVWDSSDVVLVELSELLRVEAFETVATREVRDAIRERALRDTDEAFGRLLDLVDLSRELVIVVSPVAPRGPDQLVVTAVAGPGVEAGAAQSGTTRRAGYVTLPDIAPTVLAALGIDKPGAMNGAPISSVPGDAPDAATFDSLAEDNRMALFRNDFSGPLTVVFIVAQVLTYALAAYTLSTSRFRWRRTAAWLLLAGMAVPFASFFVGLFPYWRLTLPGAMALTLAVGAALATVARAVARRVSERARLGVLARALVAPVIVTVLTAVLLIGDIAAGGPLQIDTAFGYGGGAIVAGRFSGYGNLAWALMVAAVIIAMTGTWDLRALAAGRGLSRNDRRFGLGVAAAVSGLVVLAVGLPTLGSNVGGTLSVVSGLGITLSVLAGLRLGLPRLVGIGLGTVAVLAVFGAVDLTRDPEDQTHLGRLIDQTLGEEGIAGLGTVLERKINANLNILVSSVWALIIPAAIGFLAFLVWRPPQFLRNLFVAAPAVRSCVIGVLATGFIGGVVNDSGIAIPAMMLTLLVPHVAYLIVDARIGVPPAGTVGGADGPGVVGDG